MIPNGYRRFDFGFAPPPLLLAGIHRRVSMRGYYRASPEESLWRSRRVALDVWEGGWGGGVLLGGGSDTAQRLQRPGR